MIRILIADDHVMLRMGLRSSLSRENDMEVVAEADSVDEVLKEYQQHKPDIVLIDLRMPDGGEGIETIKKLIGIDQRAKILVYSNYASGDEIYQSLYFGALGFVGKDMTPDVLYQGIRTVSGGEKFIPAEVTTRLDNRILSELTDREIDVLNHAGKGMSNKEIAVALNLAEGTVKVHMSNIRNKLNVSDRTQAVITAVRLGLIELE